MSCARTTPVICSSRTIFRCDDDERATLNIGDAAGASGVTAKMIRHNEAIGLLPPAARSESGYRRSSDNDVHTLRFIRGRSA